MQTMEFRTLGRTDLKVSRLAMGAMTFGGQVTEEAAISMVDRCLDHGINFYDTANVYNLGKSEIILGKALRGRRHKVVLATKVGGKIGEEPDDIGLKRPAIRRAIDGSLARLGTDYIDLYYLHRSDWGARIEETLATMDDLVREGKIRYPAVSDYAPWQVVQMLWHSENHGYAPPTVSQPMYNLLARGIEQEYLAFCKEFGIGIVACSPLAGGLLAGKHLPETASAPGTRFDGDRMLLDLYRNPCYLEAQRDLAAIADQAGMSDVALAFRWLLNQPMIDSVLLGASSMGQLEENFTACEAPLLSAEVLAACDSIREKIRGMTSVNNR
jgi:1-deoxyxylulose-5-phosphate synthase